MTFDQIVIGGCLLFMFSIIVYFIIRILREM